LAQRLIEGVDVPEHELGGGGLVVSAGSELPYEGALHLVEALRADPQLVCPPELCSVVDEIADDLAYLSRREQHRAPDRRRPHTLRAVSLAAAVLLRRVTGSARSLPGLDEPQLATARATIDALLGAGPA
jgi:hypothetical protein